MHIPYGIMIEEKRSRPCVKFPIKPVDMSGELEHEGGRSTLFLHEGAFIQGIAVTLPEWSCAHLAGNCEDLPRVMNAMDFRMPEGDPPDTAIRLDNQCAIRHDMDGLTVWIPTEAFIPQAIRHLADRRAIDLTLFNYNEGYIEKFREAWKECIIRLGNA